MIRICEYVSTNPLLGNRAYYIRAVVTEKWYFLWKDGTMHQNNTGFDPDYMQKLTEAPGYYPTREAAEALLNKWPEMNPEVFANYVAKVLIGS